MVLCFIFHDAKLFSSSNDSFGLCFGLLFANLSFLGILFEESSWGKLFSENHFYNGTF